MIFLQIPYKSTANLISVLVSYCCDEPMRTVFWQCKDSINGGRQKGGVRGIVIEGRYLPAGTCGIATIDII